VTEFRIFLSAVSSEFGCARDALGASLRSRDMLIRVQSDFRQQAASDTTLRKLRDYIRDCSAVVCVIGKRSGAMPAATAAAPFADMLPPGVSEASYTQWEFWFARHYKRRLSIYIATDAWVPDKPSPVGDRTDLQDALLHYIVDEQDLDRDYFGNVDRLCHLVLKEDWPREVPDKLILLPYPSLRTLFKGREAFLRGLRASLTRADGRAAAIAGRAVHGLGGVGKTRAAVEYAWAHRGEYTALALLDAETGEKLHAGLATLVGPLRLPEQAVPDEAARMEAALAWLNANPGWFLILDNIDSEPALGAANRLLGRLQGGHVVLTSRLASFPRGIERLDLDVLPLDDAADFLLAATEGGRCKAVDDAVQARALSEELGQLALALEMAAATIEARGLGFAAYRALWLGNRARVIGWADQAITGYHHAVAETWRTSVDQLTEAGRHLLERLAFLAPDPVPGFLLDVPVPDAKAEDAAAALDDLAAYSLVTRDLDGGTFLVHRLVQDVTRRGLAGEGTTTARLAEALGWVKAAFMDDPQDVRNWPVLDPLAPHAEAVVGRAYAAGIAEPTARLMGGLGLLLKTKAAYARAEHLYRRTLAIDETSLGTNHPNFGSDLNNLAMLLYDTNRLGEAEPLLRRALAIAAATPGEDHRNVATCLSNLAGLLQATNRFSEAEPLHRRALAIDEAIYGENHPKVAIRLNNLAQLLGATDRLSEAESGMRRVIAIFEANLGKDHPQVATALNNLAGLLRATNRASEAEPLLRHALAIDEVSYGQNHPEVATDLNNLAAVLQTSNRLREAEPLLRRALTITVASLGSDHPSVATCLNNLGAVLRATNRFDQAEPLMRQALAIDKASRGESHPDVAGCLNNLAELLRATNRFSEAEPLMRRALAIDEASYGKDHPSVALDLNNLAQLLKATNAFGEAELLFRRALDIDEASYGQGHLEVATDLNNLSLLLQATNRLGEAEPLMRRALAIFLALEHAIGREHPSCVAVQGSYEDLLAATGKSATEVAASIATLRRETGLPSA
jgi:tetratricopeptide (TPR) repeat protein